MALTWCASFLALPQLDTPGGHVERFRKGGREKGERGGGRSELDYKEIKRIRRRVRRGKEKEEKMSKETKRKKLKEGNYKLSR